MSKKGGIRKNKTHKLYAWEYVAIREEYARGVTSAMELAEIYGIRDSTVYLIVTGQLGSAIGGPRTFQRRLLKNKYDKQVLTYFKEGHNRAEIARFLGIGSTSVANILAKNGILPKPAKSRKYYADKEVKAVTLMVKDQLSNYAISRQIGVSERWLRKVRRRWGLPTYQSVSQPFLDKLENRYDLRRV